MWIVVRIVKGTLLLVVLGAFFFLFMAVRNWILLWLIAGAVAFFLRYALGSVLLTFHSGTASRGYPINNYAFWVMLGIAGLVTLVKLVRVR